MRDRSHPNDPVNTILPPGAQAYDNNFGMTRQINDAHSNLTDQLQVLESEKISLMKRLNMVLSELETATHEKSDVAQRLREQEHLAEELKRKLEEVSSLKNVVNRNLQDDLKYERDLNIKLREELDRFEQEKNVLIEKLREEEDLSNLIQRETDNVNSNLLRKTDDLKRLEADHEATNRRIRDLQAELEHLKGVEMQNRQHKVTLDQQLQDLTGQRNDMIRRMNELNDRYETYVSQMNAERIDTQYSNKQHVKTLVAKLLFQILDENLRRKKKLGLQEINSTAKIMINLETKVNKLQRILGNYIADRKRSFLRIWYRKAFNVVHENYKRNSIIDGNVSHKNRQKFFFLWRQLYLNRKRIYANKISAMKMINRLTNGQAELNLRSFFCRWRDFNDLRGKQEDFMSSICWRWALRAKRRAFVKWIANMRSQEMQHKHDMLSQIITETTFKQRVFLAFKHAVQQERQEMADRKFQAWKNWCEQSRKDKFFARKEALVGNIEGVRTERLLKSCFDAIKFSNTQNKFETTRAILEQKIPEREELEYKRDCLSKQTATKTKYNLLRKAYLRYCDVKYRALMIWKENCQHFGHNMERFKLRLINEHKRRLNQAFMKWKEGADKGVHMEMMVMTEDVMNENQNLTNELAKKTEIREKQVDRSGKMQISKLERVRNMFNRKSLRNYYDKWVSGALKIQNLDQAMEKFKKIENKHRLRFWLNKFRTQAKAVQRGEHIESRCDWIEMVRSKNSMKDCIATWKENVRKLKLGKRFMQRAINGVARNLVGAAFKKWKSVQSSEIQMTYMDEASNMQKHIETQDLSIKNKQREVEACKSGKVAVVAKSKNLAKKVMANYMCRMTQMQIGRGFHTWLENTRQTNQKKRTLKKTLLYMSKKQLGDAFRTWAEKHYASIQGDLQGQLTEVAQRKRELVHAGDESSKKQAAEINQLTKQLNDATAARDKMNANFKTALETFQGRKSDNIYVPKTESIFLEWVSFVKKEKNAVNVIGALARQTLRKEVFQRIRAAAREKHLDDRAIKTAKKFFMSFKNSNLRKAFLRWRENSKQAVLEQLVMTQTTMEETQVAQVEEMKKINETKVARADRCINMAKTRKMNDALKEMLRILKALRIKQNTLKQNLAYMKSKRAMQKWFQRTQVTLYLRRRNEQVIDKYKKKWLRKYWDAIRQKISKEKDAGKMMTRMINRMQYFDQAKAFQHWQQQTISLKTRAGENKEHSVNSIGHILQRLIKRRLATALHSMRMRTEKKDYKEKFLRRLLMHVGEYRKRFFYDKWKNCVQCEKISEAVNTEGDVVVRRNQLARQAASMKSQLVKMGYTPKFINDFLESKAAIQRSNMQKGIISLFFQNSDFSIVPKAFNQLKAFVQQRKRVKARVSQVLNWMNHPLSVYFRKWKYDMSDAENKLKGLSKQELIDKIIADENLIGSTESRLDRMGNSIDTLAFQRENLFGHYVRGQKLAVSLCKNNMMKTYWRAFMRWKRFSDEMANLALIEQLERTNGMISQLQDHVRKLEGINRNLLAENEELRQAALDGIEISNVVQELTKERENLSSDLHDRAGTIKRLIEDNNNLSIRLNIAQQEAQQLEQINQQVYSGPPERDF